MTDTERTHEFPLAGSAPAGSLTFDLPGMPPYEPRVVIRLRLTDGCELLISDRRPTGAIALDVFGPDADPIVTASLQDGEVHRLLLALRSANCVDR